MYLNNQQDAIPSEYGTYDNPEEALKETQKAKANGSLRKFALKVWNYTCIIRI
jgi:hypothetical protein